LSSSLKKLSNKKLYTQFLICHTFIYDFHKLFSGSHVLANATGFLLLIVTGFPSFRRPHFLRTQLVVVCDPASFHFQEAKRLKTHNENKSFSSVTKNGIKC
jgi:hypothetical protein